MTYVLGQADDGVDRAVRVQVAAVVVAARADRADVLGAGGRVAAQDGPSRGGRQVGDGGR